MDGFRLKSRLAFSKIIIKNGRLRFVRVTVYLGCPTDVAHKVNRAALM